MTSEAFPIVDGLYGDAVEWNPTDRSPAVIAAYVVTHPHATPLWDQYLAILVHLKPAPDLPPAVLHYPEAEFEISVHALDPSKGRWGEATPASKLPGAALRPTNLSMQFHGVDAGQALVLLRGAVRLMLDDLDFQPEPPGLVYDVKNGTHWRTRGITDVWADRWRDTLDRGIRHAQVGEH